MPPGSRLAMITAEIGLGSPETFLDGPSQPGRAREFGKRDAFRGKDKITGEFGGILAAASDQQPTLENVVNRPGQGVARPVIELDALRALARSERRPDFLRQCCDDPFWVGLDEPLLR